MNTTYDIAAELLALKWPAAAAARIAAGPPPATPGQPDRADTVRRICAAYGAPWSLVEAFELTALGAREIADVLLRVVGRSPAMTAEHAATLEVYAAGRARRRH